MSSINRLNRLDVHREGERRSHGAFHSVLLGGLSLLWACAGDPGAAMPRTNADDALSRRASEDELPVEHTLAELTVRDVVVTFVQTEPENVMVFAVSNASDNPLRDPALSGLTIAQMYEKLAGAPAPKALQDLPAAHKVPTTGSTGGAVPAPNASVEKSTGAEFSAQFCPPEQKNRTWDICMTDVWLEDVDYAGRASNLNGELELFNGDGVALRVREERPVKGWHTILYKPVPPYNLLTWHASMGGVYARRVEVLVEDRTEDLSQGTGFDDSDRFHYMVNVRVD